VITITPGLLDLAPKELELGFEIVIVGFTNSC